MGSRPQSLVFGPTPLEMSVVDTPRPFAGVRFRYWIEALRKLLILKDLFGAQGRNYILTLCQWINESGDRRRFHVMPRRSVSCGPHRFYVATKLGKNSEHSASLNHAHLSRTVSGRNKTALAMAFELAEAARKSRWPRQPQSVAKDHPGCEVRRRARGHRQDRQYEPALRLIHQAVTKIGDSQYGHHPADQYR